METPTTVRAIGAKIALLLDAKQLLDRSWTAVFADAVAHHDDIVDSARVIAPHRRRRWRW